MAEISVNSGGGGGDAGGREQRRLEDVADQFNVIVVSNRQPYRHERDGDGVSVNRPTGGLNMGLDAAVRRIDGSWIAWGDGDADREVVDDGDTVTVPPGAEEDQYTLRRIWLDDDEVENYYYGYSNRVLWPICHGAMTNVRSEDHYWDTYADVNETFAEAVAGQVSPGDVVWIQDYHFGLMPEMVRSRVPDSVTIAHFWHVPWPGWDTFRSCPHAEEILRGLLGNDLFGVHVPRYRQNFLDCVDAAIPEATIDWDAGRVYHEGGVTTVEAFPLGVDVETIERAASSDAATDRWEGFLADHGIDDDVTVALGVDRLDYTKGIPARFDALERFFESHPEARGALTFVQIGTKSRSQLQEYRDVQRETAAAVERINERFGTDDWQPVVYTTERLSNETLYALYRHADVCVVSPLRDGMNLVAQEFVAAQDPDADPGVLVLSDLAGAHDVLGSDTVTISPHDTDQFASELETALTMPLRDRRRHMRALSEAVREFDVTNWTDDVIGRIGEIQRERSERSSDG